MCYISLNYNTRHYKCPEEGNLNKPEHFMKPQFMFTFHQIVAVSFTVCILLYEWYLPHKLL